MVTLRSLGVLLTLVLIAWVGAVFLFHIGQHPAPEVIGLGDGFEGNLLLSAEEIKSTLESARQRMLAINNWGSWLRLGGDAAGWLSFAATAVITLVVGFYGRAPAATGVPDNSDGLPAHSVRAIGFLAALAAVLTALSSLASSRSQEYFKRTDEVRDHIVQARAEVLDAPSVDTARKVLDDLIVFVNR
jgi:hypothetical protein